MRTSETIESLAKGLAAAQAEMKNAPLNKVNPHFKSKYADMAAVRDAIMPALTKHKLSITQVTEFENGSLILCTRLMHESGQWIESIYPLPMNVDRPQVMGSAISYARRYSLAAVCGITADEDDDANVAQEDGQQKPQNGKAQQAKPQQRQQPKQEEATPFDDDESQVDTDRRMANDLRSQITATRTFDELDRVKKSADFAATYRSLPDELQREIVALGAEHREYIATLAGNERTAA